MAETTPPAIRSLITDDEFGGFRITIPATEGGRCALGCGFALWAVVLALAVLYIISDPAWHFSGGIKFLGVWVAIGLILGFVAAAGTAREIVMIEGKTLVLRRESAVFTSDQTFDLAGVRNLRSGRLTGLSGSPNAVAFEHGGRTHHFGVGLSAHEVVRLVKTIRSRFPIRDDWNDAEPLPIIN